VAFSLAALFLRHSNDIHNQDALRLLADVAGESAYFLPENASVTLTM
jgi:hypothetical protein